MKLCVCKAFLCVCKSNKVASDCICLETVQKGMPIVCATISDGNFYSSF